MYSFSKTYLKQYKRYAPDMIFLELRPEVKFTVTRKQYVTLKQYKRYAPDMIFLELRPEVKIKVAVTWKQYATLHNPMIYLHTKLGILTSNTIGDTCILQTRFRFGGTN